ncbi:MAG: UDP-N-acetylglucosamine 1-carboxyvinyltransferase, partial [Planctomycetota bacterium]
RRLHAADWRVIPDRIEAATFLALGAITRSPIEITRCRPDHLMSVIHVMREMGVGVAVRGRSLRVEPPRRFKPKDVVTLPYPAFPTDCQAQTMVLAALADGASVITERVYPERFMHAAELKRMGADIRVANGQAVVHGVRQLQGAEIMASDLRASAALVLAGLAAKGETLLHRIYHIDRGYEAIARRLGRLGARIERVGEAKP